MVKGLLLLQTKQIPPPPFLGTTNSISFRKGQPLLGFHHTELNKYTKKNDRNAPHAGSWSTVWNVMVWGRAYRSMFYSSNGEGMLICWNWGNMFLAPEKDILLVFSLGCTQFWGCHWVQLLLVQTQVYSTLPLHFHIECKKCESRVGVWVSWHYLEC